MTRLSRAISLLQKPIEDFVRRAKPHVLVSDMFFPWTVELKIPRILLYPLNAFFHCVSHSLRLHEPQSKGAERKSYGISLTSFREMEPEYSELFKKVVSSKCWNLGPLSLFSNRGKDLISHKDGSSEPEIVFQKNSKLLKYGVENGGFEIRSPMVGKVEFEKAICFLMGGSEWTEEMRQRAEEIGRMGEKEVEP
ncbi:hypothetical protein RHSIM_Rhsim06G0053400 [Rhododendron simsii]|uniref:UDP-glycosyltransferase n=1 Tax=Rhododendron simsii TaxID=118357 RepID=A0A834GXJ3_RHOSS|nr:hypothetical protein RHSIM_Rhsim06G0053400 [Rhododendron simsii]